MNTYTLNDILTSFRTIAVVGISAKPERASHDIALYLIENGFEVIPVNPNYQSVLGLKCYHSLRDVPQNVDIVNIFLRPELITEVARQAVEKKCKVLWMQLGIINNEAAQIAEQAGIQVVMDQCIKIIHRRMKIH